MNLKKVLKKFKKEGKLKLTEKSKEVSYSYNQKSRNSLKSAKILRDNNLIENSISMAYYAMYNKVLSLLFLTGIKSENHSLSLILLENIYKINIEKIRFAKKQRIEKQYYTKFKVTKKDATELIKNAEDFIEELDLFIDRLKNQDIENYKNKLRKLIN